MINYLVGYTGFVGSNIIAKSDNFFNGRFSSKNIADSFGGKPNLLIYSGITAEKYLANKDPKRDKQVIDTGFENIKKIQPRKLVLISTIEVYQNPNGVNENTSIHTKGAAPYGYHRYLLEQYVINHFDDYLIVRLPSLYGINIKKNFIFDIIQFYPSMLTEGKFSQFAQKSEIIRNSYEKQDNGFFKCKVLSYQEKIQLKDEFKKLKFSALNFTDSRACFQFYPLRFLLNLRVCELSVTRKYPKNKKAPTKISFFKGNLNVIRILLKNALGHYNPR